jgi:hypothetical protein
MAPTANGGLGDQRRCGSPKPLSVSWERLAVTGSACLYKSVRWGSG